MPPSAMPPENVVEPLVIVSVCAPSATLPDWPAPESAKVMIEAPAEVCEMSNVPPVAIATLLEVAMLPAPVSASVALAPEGAIVVAPV
jgi:hypothetical protein